MQKPHYRCPLCQLSLVEHQRSFVCENKHSFDLAKEGYLHLLPVQFKQSKNPGDNKSMVTARRSFLEKGFYQPLINQLISIYQQYNQTDGNNLRGGFFDAGCGEGFYTHQFKTPTNQVYGVDIAKDAVKKAAKKYPQCHFSVATLSLLPFHNEQLNWILSVYAPIIESEFSRVLANNGYVLTVTPAKQHLIELKSLIYREAKEHDIEKENINNLTLIHQEELNYNMHFTNADDVLNLLAMTPFAFKASEEVINTIKKMQKFDCQADFLIRLYQTK